MRYYCCKIRKIQFVLYFVTFVLTLLLAKRVSANVIQLNGKIINGTTGQIGEAEEVTIYRLQQGMDEAASLQDVKGEFFLKFDVPASATPHLIQARYKDVTYNLQLSISEDNVPESVTIPVYDVISTDTEFTYRIPHLFVRRNGERLEIRTLFEIRNNSNPPRTWSNPDGTFRFFIPDNIAEDISVSINAGKMPLNVDPIETSEKEIYITDHSFKPGNTNVSISYTVEYRNEQFEFRFPVLYLLDELNFFVAPTDVTVTAPDLKKQDVDPAQGFSYFLGTKLSAGKILELNMAGGSVRAPDTQQNRNQQRVTDLDPAIVEYTVPVLLSFAILLIFGTVLIVQLDRVGRQRASSKKKILENLKIERDRLIAEIAVWDTRFAENKVAEDIYQTERTKVKMHLTKVLRNLNSARSMDA